MTTSKLKTDISVIECEAECCTLEIGQTDDNFAEVEYAQGINICFNESESKLCIKQQSGLLAKIFGGESTVKVLIPEHMVPAIKISGGKTDCIISGGIFGEIGFSAAGGSIKAENTSIESCTINAAECNVHFAHCTVKGSLICNTDSGNVTLEYTFAKHIACHIKSGNVGTVLLNCRDTTFEVTEGNVTATVLGDESTFDVLVNSKEGTCNKESINIEDNQSTFKAYVIKGNIFVDFTDSKE